MKGYIFSICLMMVGTIALAYNNLEYSGYPRNTSCTGECYEEYVSIYGTPSEIERAKQELASADEFSSIRSLWAGCAACHGTDGKGIAAFPKLAGSSADYISTALMQYRNGETRGAQSVLMWGQAGNLTDQQIQTLSEYIEQL